MKPSKVAILFSLVIAFCFAIGFGIGAFPDQWRKLRGERPDTLVVLLSGSDLIPTQFFLDFEKATGNRVEIKIMESYHLYRTEAGTADLLFAPLAWFGSFSEILKPLPAQDEFHQLLSSDFISMKLELSYFLPVLWKTENQSDGRQHLLIWGFATAKPDKDEIHQLLSFLLHNQIRLQEWAQATPLSFTLQSSNEIQKFPELKRAQTFRDVELPNLVIDQKNDQ